MALPARMSDALAHEAPFLIEKLLKEHIVDSEEEGRALFQEVKRFIVLVRSDETTLWDMHSLRIDEAWHQFVLFTSEYIAFGHRYFDTYIQHSPSNAPEPEPSDLARTASTFDDFKTRYIELFGEEPPDSWYDERQIRPHRRVLNDNIGSLTVRDSDGMSDLCGHDGEVLISVNAIAHEALRFVCATPAFYVRELPGTLDDDEKVGLISTLVEFRVLRIGS
jgi:hypothetical protein